MPRKTTPPEEKRANNQKRQARWRENNRMKIRAQHKRWREANPDKHAALLIRWRTENPDKRHQQNVRQRIKIANDRAKTYSAEGVLTADILEVIRRQQRERCADCGDDLGYDYHIDHKLPLSERGSNLSENIQLLCQSCDIKKTTLDNKRWRDPATGRYLSRL